MRGWCLPPNLDENAGKMRYREGGAVTCWSEWDASLSLDKALARWVYLKAPSALWLVGHLSSALWLVGLLFRGKTPSLSSLWLREKEHRRMTKHYETQVFHIWTEIQRYHWAVYYKTDSNQSGILATSCRATSRPVIPWWQKGSDSQINASLFHQTSTLFYFCSE